MPSYKLTYFNFTGLGEPVRFMLSYGGIDFEDHRVSDEEWPALKPQMPLGRLPVLEIDGKIYHQSSAICRYLAKKFNVYSSDQDEALKIDIAFSSIDDLRMTLAQFFWNEDPEQAAKIKPVSLKQASFFLDKFESNLEANGGYFVGKKLTLADLYFASLYDYFCAMMEKDIVANYPNLKKLVNEINNLPNIKAYLEKRPKTKF